MMRKALAVAALASLAVSTFFAAAAYESPVKWLPPYPSCQLYANETLSEANACNQQYADYVKVETRDGPAISTYQSNGGIAEGFALVALLCLTIPRLKAPKSLDGRVALPRVLRFGLMFAALAGFEVFVFAETTNILWIATQDTLAHSLFFLVPRLPVYALLGLVGATVSFGLLRSSRGLHEGIRSGILFSAFPIAVAQWCVWAFDPTEMHLHVAMFLSGLAVYNVFLTSNWTILIVSSSLVILTILRVKTQQARKES